MVISMTEDEVRDKAREILKWDGMGVTAGVGQLTTFNQLGFKGKLDKPDGWYLPSIKTGHRRGFGNQGIEGYARRFSGKGAPEEHSYHEC